MLYGLNGSLLLLLHVPAGAALCGEARHLCEQHCECRGILVYSGHIHIPGPGLQEEPRQ